MRPFYAQIELSDPTRPGYPGWGSGEEAVVAPPTCIVVATRPHHLGDVEVEAWLGGFNAASVGTPTWKGELSLTGERAVIGSTAIPVAIEGARSLHTKLHEAMSGELQQPTGVAS